QNGDDVHRAEAFPPLDGHQIRHILGDEADVRLGRRRFVAEGDRVELLEGLLGRLRLEVADLFLQIAAGGVRPGAAGGEERTVRVPQRVGRASHAADADVAGAGDGEAVLFRAAAEVRDLVIARALQAGAPVDVGRFIGDELDI